ncbi:MAG: hypothetical protein IPG69_14570 [Flavobacteriales bacterium]|nr:hypothetical protein [Flavobacteriales bacterium]
MAHRLGCFIGALRTDDGKVPHFDDPKAWLTANPETFLELARKDPAEDLPR